MYSYARSKVGDPATAQDIVQQAFTECLAMMRRNNIKYTVTYIMKSVRNQIGMYYRHKGYSSESSNIYYSSDGTPDINAGNILDTVEAKRMMSKVQGMNIINQKIIHGLINGVSVSEMAHNAGVTHPAYFKRLRGIRKNLKREL